MMIGPIPEYSFSRDYNDPDYDEIADLRSDVKALIALVEKLVLSNDELEERLQRLGEHSPVQERSRD